MAAATIAEEKEGHHVFFKANFSFLHTMHHERKGQKPKDHL